VYNNTLFVSEGELLMKSKIFVDGQEGTTGLKIQDYLSKRTDLEILYIDKDKRKDVGAKRELLNEADIVFLCLPDAAAKESVALIDNPRTKVIDASTAHRTAEGWAYGFPELNKGHRELIGKSTRVAVPGCHASGFVAAVNPLIQLGILPKDYPISCFSVTGYSGGGKKLIEKYENADKILSPMAYALKLNHKHLPEMQKITGLSHPPVFTPIVGSFYKGMAVSVPLLPRLLSKKVSSSDVRELLAEFYSTEKFIRVMPYESDSYLQEGFLNPEECNDTNRIDLFVFGHEEQILLVSRFDNLGKGASGAAIQNMNIMLGLDEGIGLKVEV
jgi:N-acetyl-gamma-glutamyl-phosphate reductase